MCSFLEDPSGLSVLVGATISAFGFINRGLALGFLVGAPPGLIAGLLTLAKVIPT